MGFMAQLASIDLVPMVLYLLSITTACLGLSGLGFSAVEPPLEGVYYYLSASLTVARIVLMGVLGKKWFFFLVAAYWEYE